MSNMFDGCSSLSSLPDISKWNTSNVKDMSYMFSGCSSLSSLPDISKWNVSNVNYMHYIYMFSGCSSLSSLPDISKLNISNVKYMFYGCFSLISLCNFFVFIQAFPSFVFTKQQYPWTREISVQIVEYTG